MGRKSGRTKIGRSINPADAHRKQQRRKELKKNKEERKRVRLIASANKDLPKLEEELQQLKEIEKERYLDKYEKDKKKSLEEEIKKVKEAREKLGIPINNEKKTTGQETVKLLGIAKYDKNEDKKSGSKKYSSSSDSESESDSDDSSDSDSSYSSDSSASDDSHKHKHKHKHDSDNPNEMDQDEIDIDDVAQAEMMEEMEKMLPLINEEDLYNIELPKEPLPPEDKRIKIFQNLIDIPEVKAKVNTPIPNIPLQSGFQQIPPVNGNIPFMPPPGMIRPNGNFRPPAMPIPVPMNPNGRPPMMVYPPNVRPPIGMPIPPNGMIPMNIPPNAPIRGMPNRPIPMNHPPHPNKAYNPAGPQGHINTPSTHNHEAASKKSTSAPTPAAAVISAAPQLRDLQKELTTLVPSSLRRRGQTTHHKSSRKSTTNPVKPTINLAPEFDENGQMKTPSVPKINKPNENDTTKSSNNNDDDYEAFMKEISELS